MSQQNITISEDYARRVSKMTSIQYEEFKHDIKTNGLHYSIVVNQNGILLDGHHRYQACQELGKEIPANKIEVKHFDNALEELRFVVAINTKRRHYTPFQKAEAAYELEKIEAQLAEGRQKAGRTLSSNELKGQARDLAAKYVGISPTTYTRAKKVIEEATEEVKQKLRENKGEINTEYRALQSKEKRQKLIEEAVSAPTIELPQGIKLIHGDFREKCKEIPDNSIDLIFTDPPYGLESIPLYKDLAEVAARILKEGGSLVTYVGQYTLDEIMTTVKEAGLKYWWPICVKHNGQHQIMFGHGVYVYWKPLLWFVKGERRAEGCRKTIPDLIQSQPPEKALHEWEQSPIEAEHMIDGLSVENQIILDPFMGSGTTGRAALNLHRKFIGIEIDKDRFDVAKANISNFVAGINKYE